MLSEVFLGDQRETSRVLENRAAVGFVNGGSGFK
jgi:hypothetical protein